MDKCASKINAEVRADSVQRRVTFTGFSDQFTDIGNSKVFEITAARELSVTCRLTEKRLTH